MTHRLFVISITLFSTISAFAELHGQAGKSIGGVPQKPAGVVCDENGVCRLPEAVQTSYESICLDNGSVFGRGPNGTLISFALEEDGRLISTNGKVTPAHEAEMKEYYVATFSRPGFRDNKLFPRVRNFLGRVITRPRGKVPVEMIVVSATWCGGCQQYAPTVRGLEGKYSNRVTFYHFDEKNRGENNAKEFRGTLPYTEIRRVDTKEVLFQATGAQSNQAISKQLDSFLQGMPVAVDEAIATAPKSDKILPACK